MAKETTGRKVKRKRGGIPAKAQKVDRLAAAKRAAQATRARWIAWDAGTVRGERGEHWSAALTVRIAMLAGAILTAWAIVVMITTPRITFNDGLGYLDGQTYAAAVRVLRGELQVEMSAPYVYRVAPLALLALSGAPLVPGFLALNLGSLILCGPLLILLMRQFRVAPHVALICIAWWAVLPAGFRFATYYPILLDGAGSLAMLATVLAALMPSAFAFAFLLPAAILTRETAITMPALLAVTQARFGLGRAVVITLAASVAGVAAFIAVRTWPPIEPASGSTLLGDVARNFDWIRTNASERAWRYLAAPFLTLGVLTIVPFVAPRQTRAALTQAPALAVYLVAVLVAAAIGGEDFDRFAFWLAPVLVVLSARALTESRAGTLLLVALSGVHIALAWAAAPVDGSEVAYRDAVVALMPIQRALQLIGAYVLAVAVLLVLVRTLRAPADTVGRRRRKAGGSRPRGTSDGPAARGGARD